MRSCIFFFLLRVSNKHFKDHQSIVIVKRIVRNETENIKESKHTRVINVETLKIFWSRNMACFRKKVSSHIQYKICPGKEWLMRSLFILVVVYLPSLWYQTLLFCIIVFCTLVMIIFDVSLKSSSLYSLQYFRKRKK